LRSPQFAGLGPFAAALPALSIDLFVASVAEIVQKVGGQPAHLVGHSMARWFASIWQHTAGSW
jgi:pimeloyl-ACP methyl ester carboxylesterase